MATENPVIPKKLMTFYRFIPTARKPIRADASAGGTIPTRSFRYCEPIRTASSFGWYFFPPMDFGLLWDGSDVLWSHAGQPEWKPLARQHFPNFAKHFNKKAPADCKGYAVPFLGSTHEPGIVNIWSGWVGRSAPGWNTLIRPVANLPQPGGWESYEDVVETDRWFGALFVNIRLRRTGVPILVKRELPLFQAQPLPLTASPCRIIEDPGLNGGAPTPSTTDLSVEQLLRALAAGETAEHIYREYGLTRSDIETAVGFARADSRFLAILAQDRVRTALAALGL